MDRSKHESSQPVEYAPERLFSRLDPRPSDHFLALVAARPLRSLATFVAASFIFVWLITLSQAQAGTTLWLDVTPHIAVIPLVVGLVILPRRFLWIPVLIYPVEVVINIAFRGVLTPGYLIGIDVPVVAVASAAYFGAILAAAAIGRAVYVILSSEGGGYRADAGHVAATSVSVSLLGALVTYWLLTWPSVGAVFNVQIAGGDLTLGDLAVLRFLKLGAATGVFFLVFLERASEYRSRFVVLGAIIGLVMGGLSFAGLSLYSGTDIFLPLIAIALISKVNHCASLSAAAVLVYEMMTQALTGLPEVPSHSEHVLEIYSALTMVLLFGLCLRRLVTAEETSHSQRAIGRLEQVQKFVSVGYFVIDLDKRKAFIDPTAAKILGTAQVLEFDPVLARIAPNDLPVVLEALGDETSETRRFDFHISLDDTWHAGAQTRFVSVFIWYEPHPFGRRVAYGALLDLTAEDRREQALRLALARLSDQQNKQTQLFSIVSHELRTPASLIRMLIDEMSETRDWDVIEPKMKSVTEHLLNVLADMRQAVRPDQNLPVHLEPVVPLVKLELLRNTFVNLAKQNGFTIQIEGGSNSGAARLVDRTRLLQALSNLVKNAIIHSGGSTVILGYREETGGAAPVGIWTVADDGRGIPTEMRDRLFEPFSRFERAGSRHVDGSGLGLFVVKSSMEMLGGTISVVDRPEGGTEFEIRLPMPMVSDRTQSAAPGKALREAWAEKSLLVVEDSELMAELLVKRMSKVFGKVTLAHNGREAIERQLRDPHDVVLTDLFMPEMAGDQLTLALRAQGFGGTIIGMTAASIGEDRAGFENAGTDAVITKPVRVDDLLDLLSRVADAGAEASQQSAGGRHGQ